MLKRVKLLLIPKWNLWKKSGPTTPYMLTIDDVREFPKYEKTWKEIFQIR